MRLVTSSLSLRSATTEFFGRPSSSWWTRVSYLASCELIWSRSSCWSLLWEAEVTVKARRCCHIWCFAGNKCSSPVSIYSVRTPIPGQSPTAAAWVSAPAWTPPGGQTWSPPTLVSRKQKWLGPALKRCSSWPQFRLISEFWQIKTNFYSKLSSQCLFLLQEACSCC